MRIRIRWENGAVEGTLLDTPTSRALWAALPCVARAQTWGDEVYFELPVKSPLEPDARQVVEPGTLCFWVEGNTLAIPFGPTPISEGSECRLVTRVNVLGALLNDPEDLRALKSGTDLKIEAWDT